MKRKVYSKVIVVASLFGIVAAGVSAAFSKDDKAIETKATELTYVDRDISAFKDVIWNSWVTFIFDGETDFGTDQVTKYHVDVGTLNMWTNVYCNGDESLKLYNTTTSNWTCALFNINKNTNGHSAQVNESLLSSSKVLDSSITRVTIPKQTEFPSLGLASGTGTDVYRTTKDVSFVRSGSGWMIEPNPAEQEVASFFAVEPSWNPGAHPSFSGMHTYAVRFAGVTTGTSFKFGDTADATDISATIGDNITLNGNSFNSLGCKVHFAFGGFYLGLSIDPAKLTKDYNVVEIKQNTVFQYHYLNAIKLLVVKSDGSMHSYTDANKVSWDNFDYGNFVVNEGVDTTSGNVVQNGYSLLLKYGTNITGQSTSSDGYINLKNSTVTNLLDCVYVNGKLLSSDSNAIIGTYAWMLYIYIPSSFGFRPHLEIKEGAYVGKDLTGFVYLATTSLTADGCIGKNGCWKFDNSPKSISDVTYTGIVGNGTSHGNYKDDQGVDKKGLLLKFSANLSSNSSLFNGGCKDYNFAGITNFGDKVKLNGEKFNTIANAELKYFTTNMMWVYVPGMGTNGNIIEIESFTFDNACTPAMNFRCVNTSWAPATKIVFDSNGGSDIDPYFGISDSESYDTIAPAFIPTRSGYRFNCWKLDGAVIPKGTKCTGLTQTLVADWVKTYQVTFDGATIDAQTIDENGYAAKPATDPTKANAHFNGYYTDNTYKTEFDFANTPITKDTVIYVQFVNCADGKITYSEPTADHKITATLYCSVDPTEVLATETAVGKYSTDTAATCLAAETGHYDYDFENAKFEDKVENVTVGDPLGHDYGEVTVVWNGNEATATVVCERVGCPEECTGHTITETKAGSFVQDTPATCEEPNKGHYEVTFDNPLLGSAKTAKNSATGSDPAIEHDWDVKVSWNGATATASATCKHEGCEKKLSETKVGEYVKDTDATCHSYEKGHFEVTFDNTDLGSAQTEKNSYENTAAGKPEHSFSETEYVWSTEGDDVSCVGGKECQNDGCEETVIEDGEVTYEVITAPTCTDKGLGRYTATFATLDSTYMNVEIPATGHHAELVQGKTPTCAEDGYKSCYFCDDCDEYFEDATCEESIGSEADYEAWIIGDGKLAKEDVAHTPGITVIENIDEPTCVEAGSHDEVVYCEVCGEELSRVTVDDPAYGHDWDEGVVTKEATCTEDGVMTYTCSDCGEKKTEVIAAKGHSLGDLIAEVAATTEKEGMKAHYVCSVCGQYFDANKNPCTKESLVIAKLQKKGCGGSVIAASAIVTGLAIAGAALIAAKKKED